MKRPRKEGAICFEVLIPARNEEANLRLVLPPLIRAGVRVTVFDDESTDRTAVVAHELGARVMRPTATLPSGWTGKNRACHELSQVAESEWALFLDADTIPSEDFASRLSGFLHSQPDKVRLATGVPKLLPGAGLEPLYLGWVPWIILATGPFGLISRLGRGHARFTNGQIDAWRLRTLREVNPFERLSGEVLEDVKIGRLMATLGHFVEVANLSNVLSVHMYRTLGEAIDGMSKNSADVAGGLFGNVIVCLFLLLLGWGWAFGGHDWWVPYLMLALGKFLSDRIIRYPLYTCLFMPFTCTLAAATFIRSYYWRRRGKVVWKGRSYP